jgi:hypothetical protein
MATRLNIKKISLILTVGESEEISEGVYKTTLTHPKLQGGLSFVHSLSGGREEFLRALDENIVSQVLDMVDVVGELIDGHLNRNPTTSASPGNASRETPGR